jgi:hypothetical protein
MPIQQAGYAGLPCQLTFSPGFLRGRRKIPPYTDMPGFKNA